MQSLKIMKLTKETKDWLQALRSGQYTQTEYILAEKINDEVCYCALGLLYKTAGIDILEYWIETKNEFNAKSKFIELNKKINLSFDDNWKLVMWNDKLRLSFYEIANKIEKELISESETNVPSEA